jgi:type III secretion protein L
LPRVIKRPTQAPTRTEAAPRPQPPPARKQIIEREVVSATSEARRIVQEAQAEAVRIIDEANEQALETRQRGFEEGREEGLQQHTQKIAEALFKVQRMENELEPLYVRFVRECVEAVIHQELAINRDAIVGVVRKALQEARQQKEIIVRAHPEDVEALKRNERRLLEMLARATSVEIREDASLRRGGCIVVTELGTIDASLERQLDALQAAIEIELRESGKGLPDDSELDPEDDPGGGGY